MLITDFKKGYFLKLEKFFIRSFCSQLSFFFLQKLLGNLVKMSGIQSQHHIRIYRDRVKKKLKFIS